MSRSHSARRSPPESAVFDDRKDDAHRIVERSMSLIKRMLLALIASLLAVVLASVALADESIETATITLLPGDNFIGWVAEPIAVDDLFAAIPEAALIYRWDADTRNWQYAIRNVGGNFEALDSGTAATIRIEGRQSVQWERPLTPATGMVTLYRGVNWVAWNGRDEWPLDQVSRGIGKSLVNIEVQGEVYGPDVDATATIIRRGDALRVTVNRDLRWLQPTGMMPKIVLVGDIPESVNDQIAADIKSVMDFFSETFALETDFSETTILLYSDIDAAVEYEESGAEPSFGYRPDWLRGTLTAGRIAQARPWGFFMSACGWLTPSPQPCYGRTTETITHEWFHVFQSHLSAKESVRRSPVWMGEGSATWAEWQLPSDLRVGTGEASKQRRLDRVARLTEPLQSAEAAHHGWEYDLGSLAADRLVNLRGADSLLEFYRQLLPQITGDERRWLDNPSWREAFTAVFGITTNQFYEDYAAWRQTLPKATQRLNYDPDDVKLSGTIEHSDGSPATGFIFLAEAYDGEVSVGIQNAAIVDEEGKFTVWLEPDTVQRVQVKHDSCILWLTDSGLTTVLPQPGQHHDLDTRSLPTLNLTLPTGACEYVLRATITRLRDDPRYLDVLLIDNETHKWTHVRNQISGMHAVYAPKPGKYVLRVRIDECGVYYTKDGMVASRHDADVLELGKDAVSIEFRIPDTLCLHQIEGRIRTDDGKAVGESWVQVAYRGAQSSARVSADGRFSITVPESGDYVLFTGTDVAGCHVAYAKSGATSDWLYATPITVADEDVAGIEFGVPNDPSSLCR